MRKQILLFERLDRRRAEEASRARLRWHGQSSGTGYSADVKRGAFLRVKGKVYRACLGVWEWNLSYVSKGHGEIRENEMNNVQVDVWCLLIK